jgi:hypothetical protein
VDTQIRNITSKDTACVYKILASSMRKVKMNKAKNENAIGGLLGLQATNFFRPVS